MSLIDCIKNLSVVPRHQEEEYEYTSDFLEWFYHNIYLERINNYPMIEAFMLEPEYEEMYTLCELLINVNNAKQYDDNTLINNYINMKQWTINTFMKYQ